MATRTIEMIKYVNPHSPAVDEGGLSHLSEPRLSRQTKVGLRAYNLVPINIKLYIALNEKQQPILTINCLSISGRNKQKWQQLIHSNRSE